MLDSLKILCAFLASLLFVAAASAAEIHVSAAVSLKEAVTEIAKAFKTAGGDDVVFTFGSSGQLAAQIREGADVDLFISAANKQIDDLSAAKLVDVGTRCVVAGNMLVLVVPGKSAGSPQSITVSPSSIADLASTAFKKIAIGDPRTVPAGDYAMQTLTFLKINDKVSDRLVFGANVRQVLAYVESGDVAAGLVYATDARESGDKVKVVATAEDTSHEAIVYPAVIVSGSGKKEAAARFLEYFKDEKAKKLLVDRGFTIPAAAPSASGK